MKRLIAALTFVVASTCLGQPMRVAILEFEDLTGSKAEPLLGGDIDSSALAAKGVHLVGQQLAGDPDFTLVDRREFFAQMEKLQPRDGGASTPVKPSFLQAAQALRTDAVLRGSLMSFSTGTEVVDQGGYRTDFSTAAVRVSLQALDSVDGSVVAMADGVARNRFRQTAAQRTVLGEDEILTMLDKAVGDALPKLKDALSQRRARLDARETVLLSVKSTADPALVEIDGILVGTTPMVGFSVYKGDHVLTVGKAGYYDITKRILLERDTEIEAPLFRFELTAEEEKAILEKSRLNIFQGDGGLRPELIIHTVDE